MNRNHYCLIEAGGQGSRLWPLSRTEKPKQFLDLLGVGRSLLQMTYERFKKIIPPENILIITHISYHHWVKEQLPQLPDEQILLEPLPRGTAASVAYAAYRLREKNANAQLVVTPADHVIENEAYFIDIVSKGLQAVADKDILLTVGVKPTHPETRFGYIQLGEEVCADIHSIKVFTEKPDADLATVLYESGEFVWNSGIFMWSVNSVIEAFRKHIPELSSKLDCCVGYFHTANEQKKLAEVYPFFPNMSIDFGIIEPATNACVIEGDFGWLDLGTWSTYHEALGKDADGNAVATQRSNVLFYDSANNMVALPPGKLAVIQGLEGYIVTEENGVLLICKRTEEQNIKRFVTDVKLRMGKDLK